MFISGWTLSLLTRLKRREGQDFGEVPGGEGSLGDKFALVLQVARRVQNLLGSVSDAAEKYKKYVFSQTIFSRCMKLLSFVLVLSITLKSRCFLYFSNWYDILIKNIKVYIFRRTITHTFSI